MVVINNEETYLTNQRPRIPRINNLLNPKLIRRLLGTPYLLELVKEFRHKFFASFRGLGSSCIELASIRCFDAAF
jgi:hypothetical protein